MPKEEIIDRTQEPITDNEEGAEPSNGAKPDATPSSEEKLPFDDNPKWKSARTAEKKLNEILEKHGYDDIDEFEADYSDSSELRKQVGKKDVNQLLKAQDELERIHEYWAEMRAKKQMENETEDETIARLARENKELKTKKQRDAQLTAEQDEAKQLIKNYNTEVSSLIEKQEDIPKIQRKFLSEYLGVDNSFNEIDVSDKLAIRRNTKQGIEAFKKLQKAIIEDYRSGKLSIPTITPVEDSSITTSETKPKNLKEAKKLLIEAMTRKAS